MPLNKKEKTEAKRTPFAVVEAYNTIRTNLLFLLSQHKSKVVTISSPNASEGKSTTAVNVAIAFSQLGSKTLLIDADLRRPSIHKKLHVDNDKGLSSMLVGFCEADDAIKNINPHFDVLPSGPIPPNPSEILASEALDKIISDLKEKYDYIIIDTPPVNIVSDALLVAPRTDGIVMVVRDYATYHDDFKSAVASVEFAEIRILGVVLNGTAKKNGKYKFKSKYRYRYYKSYGDSAYFNK